MEEVEFDCRQSGDGRENEEAVNFLVQFPVPCLICGFDLKVDGIVKKEVGDGDGSLLTGEDNGTLFNWFLKWFGVDIAIKGKQRGGLDGDSDDGDILKFCGICKIDLLEILAFQRQLNELEEKIKNGLEAVKMNIERCEETFQSNGVYDRDQRYKRVRSRIVKCANVRDRSFKNVNLSEAIGRKSTRKKKSVSRFNSTTNNETDDQLLPFPDYMLPPPNQANGQERLIISEEDHGEVDIKPDITSIHESLPSSSPTPPRSSSQSRNVRKPSNKKGNNRKMSKSKKKLQTKSKATPPKKSSRATKAIKPNAPAPPSPTPSSPNLNDDPEDNFNEDSKSDDGDTSTDNQSNSRPKRKKRKVYVEVDEDEDYILSDDQANSLSEDDNDHDEDWVLRHPEGYHRYTYNLDPSTNTITVGSIPFTIFPDQIKITCNHCPAAPPIKNDKDAMRRHITKYHTNRYTCPHCPFRGESNGPLRLHIQTVHEGKPRPDKKNMKPLKFPCQICGKPIRHQRNHEWSHMSQDEKDVVTLKEPQRLPDWLKNRIQCEDCGKDFNGNYHLRKHREKEHEGIEKEMGLCPECGGIFKNLENHRRSQHGGEGGGKLEGRFLCLEEGCGKRFSKMRLLTRHKNAVHRKLRPWKCEVCGRGFSGEVRWREHVNGHLGVRPWKCEGEGCGAAFNRKSHLQRHMRIYHEEGSRPKRKVFLRGPTVLGEEFKKKELQREGTYYPPSALRGWAKGRVPGHLMGKEGDGLEEGKG